MGLKMGWGPGLLAWHRVTNSAGRFAEILCNSKSVNATRFRIQS